MNKLFKSTLLITTLTIPSVIVPFGSTQKTIATDEVQQLFTTALSPSRKQELVDALLSCEQPVSIADEQSKTALELSMLIPTLGSPQTVFGKKVLHDVVLNPSNDQARMRERQEIITYLSERNEFRAALTEVLSEIKDVEEDFLSFFEPKDEIFEQVCQQLYFGKRLEGLNDKAWALQAKQALKYLYEGLAFIPPTIFGEFVMPPVYGEMVGLEYLIENAQFPPDRQEEIKANLRNGITDIKKALHDKGYDSSSAKSFFSKFPLQALKNTVKGVIQGHDPRTSEGFEVSSRPEDLQKSPPKTLGDEVAFFKNGWKKSMLFTWAMRSAMDLFWAYKIRNAYQGLATHDGFAQSIHQRVYKVARLCRAMKHLDELITREYSFASFDQLHQFCCTPEQKSDGLAATVNLLSSDILLDEQKMLALRGPALAGFTLINKTKDLWADALRTIGELDMYLQIAQKLHDGQVCLSGICEKEKPYIRAVNYHNPVIKECKPSTITIGDNPIHNVLITGPHGCGKSTAQRAITYNVITTMLFGVAFADEFVCTSFTKLLVYANIRDEAERGLSSFMAECDRIESIERTLTSLAPHEFCLTLTDEVFKGTMEEEGAKRYYAFCKNVCSVPTNILISTTHFEKLVALEQDTHGALHNFSVEVDEPEEGCFVRTYRLVQGEPRWWFKDKEKRGHFLAWLSTVIGR